MNMLNRLRSGLIVAGLALFSLSAPAAAASGASEFVRTLADKAITVLQDSSVSEDAKKKHIEELFTENFDLKFISRFVLAQYWRSATEEQRQKFEDVFTRWATKSLSSRFQEYTGGPLKIPGEQEANDDTTLVISEVEFEGQQVQLNWAVSKSDGTMLIRDVTAAGVSQIITQKDEFVSVMQRQGGVDGLIGILERKLAQN